MQMLLHKLVASNGPIVDKNQPLFGNCTTNARQNVCEIEAHQISPRMSRFDAPSQYQQDSNDAKRKMRL
jgi:hypothetical protein